MNVVNTHHTKTLPSGCTVITLTFKLAKEPVNVLSITHVVVNLTNLVFTIQLNVVKSHQTKTLPSGCTVTAYTSAFANVPVNVSSVVHVLDIRTNLFFVIQLNHVNNHHANIFQSVCDTTDTMLFPAKLPVKLLSNHPPGGLKFTIVIVTQLVKLTHISFVHKLIAVLGTTVHIPSITVAVPIVAHHVPYVNVTTVQSTLPVPLIHGYWVLNVVHDAGCVSVTEINEKYAI